MLKKHLLFSPDAAEGGEVETPKDAPQAAETVVKSKVKETDASEMVQLRRERDEEKAARSKAEKERDALKTPPAPVAVPSHVSKGSPFDGCTFFG